MFTLSPWIIGTLIAYVLIFDIAIGAYTAETEKYVCDEDREYWALPGHIRGTISQYQYNEHQVPHRKTYGCKTLGCRKSESKGATPAAVIIFVLCAIVLNLATWGISAKTQYTHWTQQYMHVNAVTKSQFGFESGVSYPLVLGSMSSSIQGNVTSKLTSGLFTTTVATRASIEGGSAIKVAYWHDGTTYTLELPTRSMPISIDNNAPSSVIVRLRNPVMNGNEQLNGNMPTLEKIRHWSGCRYVISNLVLNCQRTLMYSDPPIPASVTEAGLGAMVSQYFKSAHITMTQRDYDTLIGRIN